MRNLGTKQLVLLLAAPLLCIGMLILVPVVTFKFGKTVGYVTVFCIYWFVFCLPLSLYSTNGFIELSKIYSQRLFPTTTSKLYYVLAFLPCIATFFIVFLELVPVAGFQILTVALLFALVNGTFEEMFWRGAFNKVFNNIFFACIYPAIFFGIWHITLLLAKGMVYQGGFASLVGGSLLMGLLWGWVAFQTKSIKVVTAAHIITNFFAFTGLISENWFS